jgi:hypothetical protein
MVDDERLQIRKFDISDISSSSAFEPQATAMEKSILSYRMPCP